MAGLHFLLPVTQLVTYPWRLLGLVPLLLGVAIEGVAHRALKKRQTTIKAFEESSKLLTDGASRLSRNPLYLGLLLILVGIATLLGSLTPYAVIPVLSVVLDRVVVEFEERMLQDAFGEAWPRHKARDWKSETVLSGSRVRVKRRLA